MVSDCEFCTKSFSSVGNLKYHQKNARYCLQNRPNGVIKGVNCEFCNKILGSKYNLKDHYVVCSEKKVSTVKIRLREKKKEIKILKKNTRDFETTVKKLKDENASLKDKISELEGVITGLKTAPDKKTIYNNTAYVHPKLVNLPINNIPALTREYMIERVNDGILTYEKASKGYSGLLEVISDLITYENVDGIIERSYVCTDVSRNSFHRLLESKKWKSDKGGRYLNNMLDTFRGVIEEYKDRVYDLYKNTPHESIEWGQVDWERKNISLLYSGVVCKEGTTDREELVNVLRKEISKRASV
uniref:C2H2-type domain-containing protein n=1 Tax=Marseillevirus LCMAC101 TaxID=2506602 RepID=A0A481YRT8_9VIRU|nr:MAG: hypothetical protein LCMAC101_05170 [Marseillevirus LCMAC101]